MIENLYTFSSKSMSDDETLAQLIETFRCDGTREKQCWLAKYNKGGKYICPHYNASTIRPNLVAEWHPTLNGDHQLSDFLPKSSFKAWWICPQALKSNCGCHIWQARICDRALYHGCPWCNRGPKHVCVRIRKPMFGFELEK